MGCTCGCSEEEHGGDPEYPGSTACKNEDCESGVGGCVAYEEADEETEED